MATHHGALPFNLEDRDAIARVREALDRAHYHEAAILERLGVGKLSNVRSDEPATLMHRTRLGKPIDVLTRLLLMEVAVPPDDVRQAIAPSTLEEWRRVGLLHDGGMITAAVTLVPFRGMRLAFDWFHPTGSVRPDYVMGIGASTTTLANMTVRRRSRRTLDLGTGCGVLAFLAAGHSDQVVAVDRNARAVNVASFNAALNGMTNVDIRLGDLFEPVADEEFDLIVSNPPFVISPASEYIYRDSGRKGDEITQQIIQQAPARLREGGFCHILCNWAHLRGQDWRERLARWFADTGGDAWVLRSETHDPASYAGSWIRQTEGNATERSASHFDEWMRYYDEQGIEAMSAGMITMRRRRSGPNWFYADDAPERVLGPCGEAIERGFAIRDFLESATDDAILDQKLRVAPEARIEQELEPTSEGWTMTHARVRLVAGLAYTGAIDPVIMGLISRCRGQERLRDILVDLSSTFEQEPQTLIPSCLGIVKKLTLCGVLLPESLHA